MIKTFVPDVSCVLSISLYYTQVYFPFGLVKYLKYSYASGTLSLSTLAMITFCKALEYAIRFNILTVEDVKQII